MAQEWQRLRSETQAFTCSSLVTERYPMRGALPRQSLSAFVLLLVFNGRAGPGARAGFRITRASQVVLVLLTAILTAVAGNASAQTPFILIDLGTLGGSSSVA